jgi:uncharacterized protein (DUF362 family)
VTVITDELVSVHVDPTLTYDAGNSASIRGALCALLSRIGADPVRPLQSIVRAGDQVLIKPNLVLDRVTDARAALTNGAVIKVICELVLEELEGSGRIIIADVPLQSADFNKVVAMNGVADVVAELQRDGHPVELIDLRKEWLRVERGIHRGVEPLSGDPRGYVTVNLGAASELEAISNHRQRFAVGDYDRDTTRKHHMSSSRNEYLIPATVLSSDVVINVPKLKTHKKSGITCALKNMVGICGHKSYLPHFREGPPGQGGDEFAIDHPIKSVQRDAIDRLQRTHTVIYRMARALGRLLIAFATRGEPKDLSKVMSGSWFGNDTLWRTILDLNKILFYADKHGVMHDTPQRRYLSIVDGVFSGDGDGPILPDTRHDGLLLAGRNPVLIDLVACAIMGIDPRDIKQVSGAFEIVRFPLVRADLKHSLVSFQELVRSNASPLPILSYRLPPAWDGHIRRIDRDGVKRVNRIPSAP